LVYATLLAIVPVLAFSFAVLRLFNVHRELRPLIYEFFRPMGDSAAALTAQVMEFAENVRAGLVGTVGLALLVWTLLSALKKVEDSLNFVWRVSDARSIGRRLAEYVSLLVLGPLLIVSALALSQEALDASGIQAFNVLSLGLAPLLVVTMLFAAVYALAPNTKVRWSAAIVGGLAAAVMWTVVGKLFTAMVVASARMTMVYAGLAIIIAALVWTYVGWLILLLGAQLSFYVQNPSYLRLGLTPAQLSNNDTEQLSLSIMYLIGQRHRHGGKLWTIDALARRLHLPGILVARCADALEQAGLLIRSGDEQLAPARALSSLRIVDILSVARAHTSGHKAFPWSPPNVVHETCAELDQTWRTGSGERTLLDLLGSGD
jgi:membrane protein